MENNKIIPAAVVALGIACGGFFPGYYYYQTHYNSRVVTVKGLAEKDVVADTAIWNITFTVNGNNLTEAQKQIEAQNTEIIRFLKRNGFDEAEISSGRIETNDLMANPYRDTNSAEASRFILTQTVIVRSDKVNLIADALAKSNELIGKGIVFSSQTANYFFTKLNDIKPELLKEATENAGKAAQEFAANSGSQVGKIQNANQGVITIISRDNPDAYETSQINKKVRVVSTVTYLLKD